MASYTITAEITIERQEGATNDLEITVSELFDMATFEPTFVVMKKDKTVLFTKLPADFVIVGQDITAAVAIEDTAGYVGKHRWQLEVNRGTERYIIGRGDFLIVDDITT